jgi:hypothetical protein
MSDSLVARLNAWGFQPVLLPRSGLIPPELYSFSRKHGLIRKGPLSDYLELGTEMPTLVRATLPQIEEQYSSTKRSQAALRFLGRALGWLGIAGAPQFEGLLSGSGKFNFALSGISVLGIDPSAIDRLLSRIDHSSLPEDDLIHRRLHVAYEYAYAEKLLIKRGSGKKISETMNADVAAILKFRQDSAFKMESESILSYSPRQGEQIVFAYKAGRLERAGARLAFFPEEVRRGRFGLSGHSEADGEEDDNQSESRPFLPAEGHLLDVLPAD